MSVTSLGTVAATYLIFVIFLCGACVGSFVNCAAMRKVQGEKFAKGRSHCPECGHTLGVRDLFPIVSWLFLRGRCRFCGTRISVRYPVTELVTALAFVAVLVRFGISVWTLQHCLLLAVLLALALIDLDTMELPNILLIFGVILWAVFLPFSASPLKGLIKGGLGALALGGVLLIFTLLMDKILKRETMGGGDIKLFAMLGLYCGPAVGLLLVLLSCLFGLVFMVLHSVRGQPFPFGPAIAAAAVPSLLVGPQLVSWYMGLFL